jgi:hypothetical protein
MSVVYTGTGMPCNICYYFFFFKTGGLSENISEDPSFKRRNKKPETEGNFFITARKFLLVLVV